jgi:hypothetical protein
MRTRKAERKSELPISKTARLFCPTHQTLQTIQFVTKRDGADVAVLECNCARTRYLATDKISVEKAWTPEGVRLFQANRRLAQIEEEVTNYRKSGNGW